MYLALSEEEGKGNGLTIYLAVNAIIYHMSPSFTANHHGPSLFVIIIVLPFTNDVCQNF
jgi:hypothetical protein